MDPLWSLLTVLKSAFFLWWWTKHTCATTKNHAASLWSKQSESMQLPLCSYKPHIRSWSSDRTITLTSNLRVITHAAMYQYCSRSEGHFDYTVVCPIIADALQQLRHLHPTYRMVIVSHKVGNPCRVWAFNILDSEWRACWLITTTKQKREKSEPARQYDRLW